MPSRSGREGEWPYPWLAATCLKVRDGGRIVPVAAMIAVAVDTDGRRAIIGRGLGPSDAEIFWSTFPEGLVRRGPKGAEPVIPDAPEGLGRAVAEVPGATWQRCRAHGPRCALAHVRKGRHTMVAAALRQAFLQPDRATARQTWRQVADRLRPRWPELATPMDDGEHDVLAFMAFPAQHRTKPHSTHPLGRLDEEVERRADAVGVFPDENSIMRLIGAARMEQNDDGQLQHRHVQLEAMVELLQPTAQDDPLGLPPTGLCPVPRRDAGAAGRAA